MKFNNYTTIHGRVVKAYELPLDEVDDINTLYEIEKNNKRKCLFRRITFF